MFFDLDNEIESFFKTSIERLPRQISYDLLFPQRNSEDSDTFSEEFTVHRTKTV